jgi:D-glycero-D-manno-heptose 1,7-bisphosphate phosphatase
VSLIILDRDGVINYESNAYIKSPEEWQALPGSLAAIAALNRAGFQVVVATNQSGLARGLFNRATLEAIHAKLARELAAEGGELAGIFFCPHHPDDHCSCRKPKPGLFWQIREKYPVDFSTVFFVGDSSTDLEAAKNAGCKPLLVLTGNGQRTLAEHAKTLAVPYFFDLAHAVEFIIHAK